MLWIETCAGLPMGFDQTGHLPQLLAWDSKRKMTNPFCEWPCGGRLVVDFLVVFGGTWEARLIFQYMKPT
eukprot:1520598-Amphidinium_carterae.1